MPKVDVLNASGTKVSDIQLHDEVFGIEPNQQVLYDVVNAQRAAMRQGTHDVKNRSEVSGGGKKPWRQKGTGRARQGSIRSPQWRGGGIVFGPTPRSYAVKVNKKVARLALRSALSYVAKNKTLVIVDEVKVSEPKTKLFQQLLDNLKVEGKVLFIVNALTENETVAARNIPTVAFTEVSHVSVYDILNTKNLVIEKQALAVLEGVLTND